MLDTLHTWSRCLRFFPIALFSSVVFTVSGENHIRPSHFFPRHVFGEVTAALSAAVLALGVYDALGVCMTTDPYR